MKLAFNKPRKVTKPDFQKKIWFIHKVQKCTFLSGFSTFSGNLAMNFHLFLIENDSTKCLWTACENRMFSKNPVLEIFIHKVEILAKNGKKWCLKIVLYLQNRKCYRKSDLIFGIYDKFSFPDVASDFCLLFVFREKNWPENGQFSCIFWMVFGHFFANYLAEFDETCFHFAHYDRPQRFLAGTGGFSRQKNLFCLRGPIKLCLQINFCL